MCTSQKVWKRAFPPLPTRPQLVWPCIRPCFSLSPIPLPSSSDKFLHLPSSGASHFFKIWRWYETDISFRICMSDLPINSVLVALYCIPSFNVFLLAVLDQIFCFSHPPPISSLKTHTIISPLTTHSSSSSTPSRYLRLAMITSSTPEFRPPNWDPLWPQLDSPFQAPPMLGWGKMKNTSTFRSLALKWFLSSFSLFLSLSLFFSR